MMIIRKLFSKKYGYKAYVFTLLLAFLCLYPAQSFAAKFPDCYPSQQNGSNVEKCDTVVINHKCVEEQKQSKCLDVMPVKTVRISETVCKRPEVNHNAMDYSAVIGETVKAAADGVVERVRTQNCNKATGKYGGGRIVTIRHPIAFKPTDLSKYSPIVVPERQKSFVTTYMHLASYAPGLTSGQAIEKGDPIGTAGGSGCIGPILSNTAYGSHLHFEISDGEGSPMDPMCADIMNLCEGKKAESTTISYPGSSTPQTPASWTEKTNANSSNSFDPYGKCATCNGGKCSESVGKHSSIPGAAKSYGSGGSADSAEGAGGDGCSIRNYKESFKDCLFCGMFMIVFNTSSSVASIAFNILQMPVINVVLLGFALWLSYTLVKFISSMEQKEPRKMIKEILTQTAIVLFIIVLLLFGSTGIFSLFLEPIFNTGIRFAMLVANASGGNNLENGKIVIKECPVFKDILDIKGGLPASMGQNILCIIKSVQDMLMDVISLGATFVCLGFFDEAVIRIIFPHVGYVLTGLGLYIGTVLVLVVYPWLLIDSVLRMSVAVAIFPAALGAAAFKTTRKYIGMVFGTFLTSMFNFIFLTIIIFLLIELVYQTIGSTLMNTIQETDDSVSVMGILNEIGWWGVAFLKLVFILVLTYAMMGEQEKLASSFGSIAGSGMNVGGIGSSVGTGVMSTVKQASRTPRELAEKGIKNVAGHASRNTKSAVHSARTDYKANKIEKQGVKNEDGSITRTKKSLFGKVTTQTVTRGENGQPLIKTTSTKGNKTTTTETSKMMSKTTVVDNKTGKQLSEKFEMKDAGLRKLMNKKGEVDMVSVNNLLKNSGHSQEDCLKGVMSQVLTEKYGKDNKMMDPKGTDQKIEIGKDEKGQMTFSMSQKNEKGLTQNFNMTLGDKRIRTEVETIDKKGRSQALISDGIFNMTSNRKYNEDRSDFKSKNSFSINSYYDGDYRNPIKGKKIDKKVYADTMLTDKELRGAIHQKRKYGKLQGE